jgi:hypothetical protein
MGARATWWTLGTLLLALLHGAAAAAAEFQVQAAETRLINGVYRLDAQLSLEFSDEVLEALDNGVPIDLVLEIEILRQRSWVWDEDLASLEQRHQLRHHALSQQYVVKNLNTGVQQAYPNLAEAKAALGQIRDFPMLDQRLLKPGEHYRARLRVRLDIESLPAPLRPLAYLFRGWRLTSDWYEWTLQ